MSKSCLCSRVHLSFFKWDQTVYPVFDPLAHVMDRPSSPGLLFSESRSLEKDLRIVQRQDSILGYIELGYILHVWCVKGSKRWNA